MKQKICRWMGVKAGLAFALACSILTFFAQSSWATDPYWYAVQVSATVQSSPAQITLSWPVDPNSQGYTVSRKAPSATSWSTIASLPGNTGTYTDTSVTAGSVYEYKVSCPTPWNYTGYGYLQAGINAPLVDSRGKVLLIVDSTYASDLATELTQLQQDLVCDGWTVIRKDVSRTDSAANVKNVIKTQYNADPQNVKSVFLFGHVPVPYSGDLNPDGHPDHKGAWPADGYYGDMDGNWTDSSVNDNSSGQTRNWNTPGDGKFDQSELPSDVELQVGRVDFANMTAIANTTGQNERDLLRQYLNKDHNFRVGTIRAQRRGLICDNFGESSGEAFASSGWRNFAAFFGAQNVTSVGQSQYFPTIGSQDYLWSYGCGGGSYTTCYGIGATEDFGRTDIKSVFTMFLGSYFGDWDAESDFMRGPLCSKTYGLVCMWAGRPHWFVHPMGLGETVGYCAKLTQNNSSTYSAQVNYSAHGVHVGLLGDPTLRMHVVLPPSNLTVSSGTLKWTASTDSDLQGYHVYRASSASGPFTRVTTTPITATTYTDSSSGTYTYMVRAIKLERSGSGTYYNASQGVLTAGTSSGGTGSGGSTGGSSGSSTNVVTDPTNSVPVTNIVAATGAVFVKTDTTTQGSWKGVYGAQGYVLMGDGNNYPAYAQLMPSSKADWTWQSSTTDTRAVQKASATDRLAACWYSSGTWTIDLNLTDGQTHRVAIYCLDWDNNGRVQTIDVSDASSGAALNSQSVSGFGSGKYLVWDMKGHVKISFTRNSGYNAVMSAIFFDASSASTPTPVTVAAPTISPNGGTFTNSVNVTLASTTAGATIRYTLDGSTPTSTSTLYSSPFALANSATVKAMAFANGTNSTASSATFTVTTPAPTPVTIAAPAISPNGGTFTNSVNVTLASTTSGATIRYTLDGSTPTSASTLYSSPFSLANSATVKAMAFASGTNSAVSTATFTVTVPAPSTPPSTNVNDARFVSVDTTTQGTWKGVYGSDGYAIPGYAASLPAYAQVTASGKSDWTWQSSTTDVRATQKPGTATDRIASCWYSGTSFALDVNLTDGKFHRVALYCLDWDQVSNRSQTVEVSDATTGAVLNTQTVSAFANGKHLVWDVKGHVKIKVTKVSGYNGVANALLFSASPTL